MISTKEALNRIEWAIKNIGIQTMQLKNSLGCFLAENILSPIDLPLFDQSAMDGYAIKLNEGNKFKTIGEIQAGDDASNVSLENNHAIKIFTGAMCPDSADLVCRIEDITEEKSDIVVAIMPDRGANIRRKGEQIKQGELALKKGHLITPATIGFLANLGITEVSVVAPPKVAILSTGNELCPPGQKLPLGKIYESNSIMLEAALQQYHVELIKAKKTVDTLESTITSIADLLSQSDILIITGGISVGDYDYVAAALEENGVEQVFHKVSQKPGKPFYFGTKGGKLIFALPGNPAAVLTCFYIYVLPAIQKFKGGSFEGLPSVELVSSSKIEKTNAREQFLKAYALGNEVRILEGQSSAMLHTFAESNAIVYLPAHTKLEVGEKVLTYKIH
jgi:molybdopterin molybdotransferase